MFKIYYYDNVTYPQAYNKICSPDRDRNMAGKPDFTESTMKVISVFLILFLVICATAFADWAENFYANYEEQGIDHAVKTALGEGNSPDRIVRTALPIKDLEQDKLIKALFCGLALPGSIYEAAEVNGIPESTVAQGYQLALAECAREMEENLNAAVSPANPPPELSPSKRVRGSSFASPWKFE